MQVKLEWSADPSLTVVLAAKGYPGPYSKGGAIHNLEAVTGAKVFHAGTSMKDGQVVSTGRQRTLLPCHTMQICSYCARAQVCVQQ